MRQCLASLQIKKPIELVSGGTEALTFAAVSVQLRADCRQ
jgi:hypothetical protein